MEDERKNEIWVALSHACKSERIHLFFPPPSPTSKARHTSIFMILFPFCHVFPNAQERCYRSSGELLSASFCCLPLRSRLTFFAIWWRDAAFSSLSPPFSCISSIKCLRIILWSPNNSLYHVLKIGRFSCKACSILENSQYFFLKPI